MDFEFKFESYEDFYGSIEEIKQKINLCKFCGKQLILNHQSDYKNLVIHETARCIDCGDHTRKITHQLN